MRQLYLVQLVRKLFHCGQRCYSVVTLADRGSRSKITRLRHRPQPSRCFATSDFHLLMWAKLSFTEVVRFLIFIHNRGFDCGSHSHGDCLGWKTKGSSLIGPCCESHCLSESISVRRLAARNYPVHLTVTYFYSCILETSGVILSCNYHKNGRRRFKAYSFIAQFRLRSLSILDLENICRPL